MTTASIAERTETVIIRDVRTTLQPFSTGQAAFNWARRNSVEAPVTVLVKQRMRAASMVIARVGEHYEGR